MTAYEMIAWLGRHVGRTADLCLDSRQVTSGDVFFACAGQHSDGHAYIKQALQRGAAAIISEAGAPPSTPISADVPHVAVRNLRSILGQVAHHWYREPSHALTVVAVTGTNGKTTCVHWIAAALNSEGLACGSIGTLGVVLPDGRNLGGALTTPDVLAMHRSLARLRDAGALVVALEASSIGIVQGRLDHVKIEIAAFTNLSHDHLDYHDTLSRYKEAKTRLFTWPRLGAAIINRDDPMGAELIEATSVPTPITYSKAAHQADVEAQDIQSSGYGLVFNLKTSRGSAQLLTRLVGEHNISNLLLVAAVLRQLGWGLSRTVRALGTLRAVDGRLELVDPLECGESRPGPLVVVDYAHTPDALERALQALAQVAHARGGEVVCVFGCGGNRDRTKRPMMGQIAVANANHVIVTNDNPRDEEPGDIIEAIVAGMPSRPLIILDRAEAIMSAIWGAQEADVVLLAGKGHETIQEFRDIKLPFDDREWAKLALTWMRLPQFSSDSRHLRPGELFIALKGEHFDGHDYVEAAQAAGACGALVEARDHGVALPQIALGNMHEAIITIARTWRHHHCLPVIAVTGSNGKTTTKEMIAAILRARLGEAAVLSTLGNLNNHIGVPLTVLRLSGRHQAAVVELGMNRPGEIELLASIARPSVALVNNAQREHQEFMHTVEAVARENGAVLEALRADGVAVFPGDDQYTPLWTTMAAERRQIRFGFDEGNDVFASEIYVQPSHTDFHLHIGSESAPVRLQAPGLHNLRNALAAASCAWAAGTPIEVIARGLQSFNPVAGRLHIKRLPDGTQLIDDSYNANPDSVRAAIDFLSGLSAPTVLVLGDMAEIGPNSTEVHAEVGTYAQERGVSCLLSLGLESAHAAKAFGAQGQAFDTLENLMPQLIACLPANVLVKGSRSARMERVLEALDAHLAAEQGGLQSAT